jgi:hypothetical protein
MVYLPDVLFLLPWCIFPMPSSCCHAVSLCLPMSSSQVKKINVGFIAAGEEDEADGWLIPDINA